MKGIIAALLVSVVGAVFAGPLDKAWLRGTTDKDPLAYKSGEEIVVTLTPMGITNALPADEYFLDWKRTDDFGGLETGRVAFTTAPFVYRAKLGRPGFVRLEARVVDKVGNRTSVFFDGGAGVEPENLAAAPEPKDFDAFWKGQYARLEKVPVKADLVEVPCQTLGVRIYAVRVDCAGLRPVTGYLSVPKGVDEGKTYPARLETHGYSGDGCQHKARTTSSDSLIVFNINAHGLKLAEFGATEADTKALRWEIRSHDCTYAFDAKQNADPEVAYFNGMVLRVKRGLQYLKTVKGWNGRDLIAVGGSQGGLQTIWAAACGEGVTRAESGITWCCDMPMNGIRRERKVSSDGWYIPWTDSMGYYDAVNFAKRIPPTCRTIITRAGLGDYCCPPMGLAKLYNNIPANKTINWFQGSRHGYVPPEYEGRTFVRTSTTELGKRIARICPITREDVWYGHRRTKFRFAGHEAWVVEPSVPPACGTPWTWTMQWAEAFVERTGVPELLKRGYHHVTIDLFETRMDEKGLADAEAFQAFLVKELGFAPKANLVGMSWGGFFSTRYAAAHPQNVAKIYLDAPLMNFDGFKMDIGIWANRKPADGLWSNDPHMPVNLAVPLAQCGFPILLAYGGKDETVPPAQNCELFIARFREAGGTIDVRYRASFGHHPHGFGADELSTVTDFFRTNACAD